VLGDHPSRTPSRVIEGCRPLAIATYRRVRTPAANRSVGPRNPRDDLDLEIEARQPVHAHRGPVRVGRVADRLQPDDVDRLPLRGRVGMEGGHVVEDIQPVDAEAAARLLNGAALSVSLWIAASDDLRAVLAKAIEAFRNLAAGLLRTEG
jgi:hypothetical protein